MNFHKHISCSVEQEEYEKSFSCSLFKEGNNGDVCQNPCPVVDRETGRILLLACWNKITDSEAAILYETGVDDAYERTDFVLIPVSYFAD